MNKAEKLKSILKGEHPHIKEGQYDMIQKQLDALPKRGRKKTEDIPEIEILVDMSTTEHGHG